MKFLYVAFAAIFLLFAFVQINDPDPLLWILIYGIMAVTCILAAFRLFFKPFLLVLLIVYVAYSTVFYSGVVEWLKQPDRSILFDDVLKMQYPYIEEAREFLGLVICIVVLLLQIIHAYRRKSLH